MVFSSEQADSQTSLVATEAAIASNLTHANIVATYSHDIVGISRAHGPELGVYKFYLIQVRFPSSISPPHYHHLNTTTTCKHRHTFTYMVACAGPALSCVRCSGGVWLGVRRLWPAKLTLISPSSVLPHQDVASTPHILHHDCPEKNILSPLQELYHHEYVLSWVGRMLLRMSWSFSCRCRVKESCTIVVRSGL